MGGPPRVSLVLVLLLAGCDTLLKLQKVPQPDAFVDFDTDGDGFLDSGDDCPAIADPDQIDSDGDGVGDACDPHAGLHDVVVVSELCHGDASRWIVSGPWTMEDGAWTSPDPATGGALALMSPRQLTDPAIQIGFTMVVFDDAQLKIENLKVTLDAPTEKGDCTFRHDPNASTPYQIVMHSTNGTMFTSKQVPAYAIGTRYIGTYTRGTPNATCTVAGMTDIRPDDIDTLTTAPAVSTELLQARIDSIVIYQVAL